MRPAEGGVVDPREDFGAALDGDFAALGVFFGFGLVELLALGLADGLGVALGEAVPVAVSAAFGWVVAGGEAAVDSASTLWPPGSNAMTR
ncbi:hypothetical protein [Streptomyces griseorubiginosus]